VHGEAAYPKSSCAVSRMVQITTVETIAAAIK
jgi:hypothetical protein